MANHNATTPSGPQASGRATDYLTSVKSTPPETRKAAARELALPQHQGHERRCDSGILAHGLPQRRNRHVEVRRGPVAIAVT